MAVVRTVSKRNPCAVCEGDHKCSFADDGLLFCGRRRGVQEGFIDLGPCKNNPVWNLYRRAADAPPRAAGPGPGRGGRAAAVEVDYDQRIGLLAAQAGPQATAELAGALGLPAGVLLTLPVGFQAVSDAGPVWFFPERDASGAAVGLQRRFRDGSKRNVGHRGLSFVPGFEKLPGPVFCPEGASDTLALAAMNLCAVGRPSNSGGVELLAALLRARCADRPVVVVGERDRSERGWPGREGAVQTAAALSRALGREVLWALPPEPCKDVRAWVLARKMDPTCADEWAVAGEALSAALRADARPADEASLFDGPPVPLAERHAPPPFPLGVLPGPVRQFARQLSGALACPPDYVAVPMLALAGAALGNAWRLRLTASHQQHAALFSAVVGPPGSAKSPALAAVAGPLHRLNGLWLAHAQAAAEQAEGLGVTLEEPARRCVLDDFTTESLPGLLRDNPKGVAVVKDELAGLIHGLNQYKGGRGSDRQVLLALWAGADVVVDRKGGKGPVHAPRPFVAVVGGIQPAALEALRPRRCGQALDDGLIDRFLFSCPEPAPAVAENWQEVSSEAAGDWQFVLERLATLGLPDVPAGTPATSAPGRPLAVRELPLSETGRQAWEAFTQRHAAEANGPGVLAAGLAGVWSKMRGYCARVALVLQALRWVCGETGEEHAVDGASVRDAEEVINYFKAHARRVHGVLQTDPVQLGAERAAAWLAERPAVIRFTRGELWQHVRRHFGQPRELGEALELLADLHYLSATPGPRPVWTVNPQWRRG